MRPFCATSSEGATILPYDTTERGPRRAEKRRRGPAVRRWHLAHVLDPGHAIKRRCCEFKGEGYTEPRYFGDGVGIAIKKGNGRLREVLDYALARVKASGRYEELMLRYFPLPLY